MPNKADYAKINIACKELGLDKYQLISDRYGLESSKQLTTAQLFDLYRHFKSLGWKVRRRTQSKASPRYVDSQARKVVAMWLALAKNGIVKDRSDQALQAYVKRMTGIDNLKWCEGAELFRLIESLKKWGGRHDLDLS